MSNVQEDSRWVPLLVPPSSAAQGRSQKYPFADIVTTHARKHEIDPSLVRAIIKVESDFDPRALSHKGAMGLMQILPQTARRYGRFDLHEPNENIRVGVRHLKHLLKHFRNNVRLTLAAYHAGAAAVAKHDGVPPFSETIEYIGRVLRYYQNYRHAPDTSSVHRTPQSGAGEGP